MESFAITTDCIELGNTLSKASLVLNEFVREVREARSDLNAVSRELHSLQIVLDLLKDDAANMPSRLATRTPLVLQGCNRMVEELDKSLMALDHPRLSRSQKRSQWISVGKPHIADLQATLEAHRIVIGLALDLVGVTSGRDLHDSSEQGDYDEIENRQRQVEVRNEATRILEELQELQETMPSELEADGTEYDLHSYATALRVYANSLITASEAEDGAYVGEGGVFSAYMARRSTRAVEAAPDSAVEVSDGASSCKATDETPPSSSHAEPYLREVHQLMGEMLDDDDDDNVPSRPPTPPPKDVKRIEVQRRHMATPFDTASATEESFGVITEISSAASKSRSQQDPARMSRLGSFTMPRWFGHKRNALSETSSSQGSVSSDTISARPITPIIQASLVRRGSKRLSTSIKRLPLWTTELEDPEGPASPGSNAVFGVSLAKSMQAARSSAKTHHSGSGSSRREFPLCIHRCVNFLMKEGVEAPDVFAEPGDGYRVQKLKEAFSRAPKYGEDVNWDNYGVYDAADIILLFLSQLSKPLVSEAVAKRWISLSRQATLSGSHSTRLDQCIDFWEEALGGMRGPSRSVFKLLLNLWSSIADAADQNDMTAERLAGVLLKPLMHTSSEKYSTDYMLGLAFLIRKRSEYIMMLNEGRPSRSAF